MRLSNAFDQRQSQPWPRPLEFCASGAVMVNVFSAEKLFKADTIVCAVGQRSLTSMVDQLRNTPQEFYHIGDCVRPGRVKDAVIAGYYIAMSL